MGLVFKVLVCQLVCLHIAITRCQQPKYVYDYLRPQLILYDARKILHDVRLQLPKTFPAEFKPFQPAMHTFGGYQLPWRQDASRLQNDIITKPDNNKNQETPPVISLDRKDQKKIQDKLFKTKSNEVIRETYTTDGSHSTTTNEYTTETTTDYESTTFDVDEIANRISPEVVASLLG